MTEAEEANIKRLARDEFNALIQSHVNWCPFSKLEIEKRLRQTEGRFSMLIGFMIGSGILGGAAGGLVAQLMK
jgi:hypothetical protein